MPFEHTASSCLNALTAVAILALLVASGQPTPSIKFQGSVYPLAKSSTVSSDVTASQFGPGTLWGPRFDGSMLNPHSVGQTNFG